MNMDSIEDLYYNPARPTAFSGVSRLLSAVRRLDPKVTRQEVTDWLASQDAYTLHKPLKQKFARRRTIVPGPSHQLQADLLDVRSRASSNDGTNYLLTAIDVFSKKAWAVPVRSKSGEHVAAGLSSILDGETFLSLQTDKGKEFYNDKVARILLAKRVKHFSTENETIKASIVERFNRTIRDKIHRYLTANNTLRFVDVLPQLVRGYNTTPHGSTGFKPEEIGPDNQSKVSSGCTRGLRLYRQLSPGYFLRSVTLFA